jgi:hypothetical protein
MIPVGAGSPISTRKTINLVNPPCPIYYLRSTGHDITPRFQLKRAILNQLIASQLMQKLLFLLRIRWDQDLINYVNHAIASFDISFNNISTLHGNFATANYYLQRAFFNTGNITRFQASR